MSVAAFNIRRRGAPWIKMTKDVDKTVREYVAGLAYYTNRQVKSK